MLKADNLTTFTFWLSRNMGASTSWNPQGQNLQVCNGNWFTIYILMLILILCRNKSGFSNILTTLCMEHYYTFVCFWRNSPQLTRTFSFFRFLDNTKRHTTVGRTPLDEWSARRRALYVTTQHSKQTDKHAPSGIRIHNLSKLAAADARLRQRGHWDRHYYTLKYKIFDRSIHKK